MSHIGLTNISGCAEIVHNFVLHQSLINNYFKKNIIAQPTYTTQDILIGGVVIGAQQSCTTQNT
jgi:hypothetical protein